MSEKSVFGKVMAKIKEIVENINFIVKVHGSRHDLGANAVRLPMLLEILQEADLGEDRAEAIQKLEELLDQCKVEWVEHDVGYTIECLRNSESSN